MGDYLKNGAKIGTCGQGYYATYKDLVKEAQKGDEEAQYYIDPEKKCSHAFPYPEFRTKKIGDYSVFHMEQVDLFVISIPKGIQSFHGHVHTHIRPSGGKRIVFSNPCPHNEDDVLKFYLRYTTFYAGKLSIVGECIYCGTANIFDESEACIILANIAKEMTFIPDGSDQFKRAKSIYNSIAEIYNLPEYVEE